MAKIITEFEWYGDGAVTNLGPTFKASIGGATEITVHRNDGGSPRITWINTYGNTTANRLRDGYFRFVFSEAAEMKATRILDLIQRRQDRPHLRG